MRNYHNGTRYRFEEMTVDQAEAAYGFYAVTDPDE